MHSLREWGRVKQKLCKQACKIFAFFCQSQLDGIIRAHLRNPWLVLLQPRPTRGLLKTLIFVLREDAPTFIDRMNLCEKLGIIPSAEELIAIRDLRNIIAHEYLSENLVEIYREIIQLSNNLIKSIALTDKFLSEIKFHISQ